MNFIDEKLRGPVESIEVQLMARIRRAGRGSVWCAERFGRAFSRNAVDQALLRMAQRQTLVRIAHGVYLYPIPHPLLGIAPATMADVHEMLVAIRGGPVIAYGATAAAQYGFVPADGERYEYAGVGVSRTIVTRWWSMHIRPIAPRFIVGLHPQTAMVIQAMRYIGQKQWNNTHTQLLQHRITDASAATLCDQVALSPAWMRTIIATLRVPASTAAGTT